MTIAASLTDVVRERGRLTVAAFMDLALYDPAFGYYARAPRRSGRAGDFFTSVDVGPLFGELLGKQVGEMGALLGSGFDIVEVGGGDGRLAADVMRSLAAHFPGLLPQARLHLVEASARARDAQAGTLQGCLSSSTDTLPVSFEGVLYANELLDAFPVHQVIMGNDGLHEVFVEVHEDDFVAVEGQLSTPALSEYLQAAGVTLEPGARAEINLQAVEWMRTAARALRRGFLILIDYGHEARELYSATHAIGTLTSFTSHIARGPESDRPGDARRPAWLASPGEQDLTAHVDFTSVRRAAEAEGLVTLGLMDQTYFLMGLAGFGASTSTPPNLLTPLSRRAFSTLTMPGGLGSTMKVLILGKDVGRPALAGCSWGSRMT